MKVVDYGAMGGMNRAPDGSPVAFEDFPAEAFPVKLTAFGPDDAVLWERVIEPYTVVAIPGPPPGLAGKVSIRIELATGEVFTEEPMSAEEADAYIAQEIERGASG